MMNWIKVSDRLPSNTADVLVIGVYCGDAFVYVGCYDEQSVDISNDNDGWDIYNHLHHDVTHWMPLPETPKGG